MDLVAFLRKGSTHTPPPLHMDGGAFTFSSFVFSATIRSLDIVLGAWGVGRHRGKRGGGRLRDSVNCGYRRLDTGHWAWRCLVLDLGEIPLGVCRHWVYQGRRFFLSLLDSTLFDATTFYNTTDKATTQQTTLDGHNKKPTWNNRQAKTQGMLILFWSGWADAA